MVKKTCLIFLLSCLGISSAYSQEGDNEKKKINCNEEKEKICESSSSGKDECISKNIQKLSPECRDEEIKKLVDTNSNDCVTQIQQACEGRDLSCLKDLGTQVSDKCAAMVIKGHPDSFLNQKSTKTLQQGCFKSFEEKCASKTYGKFDNAAEANREMLNCMKELTSKKAYGKECEESISNLVKDFKENRDLYKAIQD